MKTSPKRPRACAGWTAADVATRFDSLDLGETDPSRFAGLLRNDAGTRMLQKRQSYRRRVVGVAV